MMPTAELALRISLHATRECLRCAHSPAGFRLGIHGTCSHFHLQCLFTNIARRVRILHASSLNQASELHQSLNSKNMSISAPPDPPRVSLLGLPAELRLHIYELLTSTDPPCWRVTGTADWQEHVTTARTGFFALATTCSLTRHETKPLLATALARPSVELVSFTREDADLWIASYASKLSKMCCITIQLWAGCGNHEFCDMKGGHYLTCAAQKKKDKKTKDHMKCDEQCHYGYGYGYLWEKTSM